MCNILEHFEFIVMLCILRLFLVSHEISAIYVIKSVNKIRKCNKGTRIQILFYLC